MTDHSINVNFEPIGFINTWFQTKNGTPRQPSVCNLNKAALTISKSRFTNPEHSLISLDQFSHIWLIFLFHKNNPLHSTKAKVSPPRLNGIRVGVFSTRSPHRPNPIGLTLVELVKIEDATLHLRGVDLVDGTPILDIKPYIPQYDQPKIEKQELDRPEIALTTRQPSWITANPLIQPLKVRFTPTAHQELIESIDPLHQSLVELESAICQILSADPRSVYRRQQCTDRLYYCTVDNIHVTCWFDDDDNVAEVLKVKLNLTTPVLTQ